MSEVGGGDGALVVDCLGKACPVPVIELAKAIGEVAIGGHVVVVADDPGAKVDIPVWCRMKAHDLVGVDEAEPGWRFRVRRAR
ncbi:MAG: sulfurtransferase TusA family protein [Actinomycetota bacterium]|nr:sulfurtransferase TusA family protein [Actinomycetota bacterium]